MSEALLDSRPIKHTWLALGPAGTLGWITKSTEGYTFKLVSDSRERGSFPSLEVAKNALYASLAPGSDWPEFSEH
jgi:hypothetical protein